MIVITMITRIILLFLLSASLLLNGYLAFECWHKPTKQIFSIGEPVVMRTSGGLLEVSTVTATEVFESQQHHTLWLIPMGKTVSSIRVPATYKYHIELAPDWKIYSRDKELIVITPPVKPSLPVAIDTKKLETQTSGVWSLVIGNKLIADLQRSITVDLGLRALSSEYIQLQREDARKTVREFVTKWALTQSRFKQLDPENVKIYFADERLDFDRL